MDEHTDYSAVWKRVLGEPASAQSADLDRTLREFMDDEAHDCSVYAALAGRTRGRTRCELLSISADEAGHRRKLETEYFIETGGSYAPECAIDLPSCTAEALRIQYAGEKKGAAEYEKAATLCNDARRAELFRALAADETRHARTIACLLGRMI